MIPRFRLEERIFVTEASVLGAKVFFARWHWQADSGETRRWYCKLLSLKNKATAI